MRIIGGEFAGKRFAPKGKKWPTRPTTDFAKEALYNILQNRIDFEEVSMLDLFGGFGNHTLEFISRGAEKVCYVDNYRGCTDFVRSIGVELGVMDRVEVYKANAFSYIKTCSEKFDVVFCDPPYDHPKMPQIPALIFDNEILKANGLLIVEHRKTDSFSTHPNFAEVRSYGGCSFSFFNYS